MYYTDDFMYESGIDFIIVNFYREEYVELLIESIHKYTKGEYSIYLINNGNNTGENNDYDKLKEFYKDDKTITVLKGEEQKNEVRPEDGAIFKCKIDLIFPTCKTLPLLIFQIKYLRILFLFLI